MPKQTSILEDLVAMQCTRMIHRTTGKVIKISPPQDSDQDVYICFEEEGGEKVRILPKEQLEAADADFPDAEVERTVYLLGPAQLIVLRRIGPSREELLQSDMHFLTSNELAELDRW